MLRRVSLLPWERRSLRAAFSCGTWAPPPKPKAGPAPTHHAAICLDHCGANQMLTGGTKEVGADAWGRGGGVGMAFEGHSQRAGMEARGHTFAGTAPLYAGAVATSK